MTLRPSLPRIQALVAWAVVGQAILARYAPGASWAVALLAFGVVGALARTGPVVLVGPGARWREALQGGAALGLLGTGLAAVWRASTGGEVGGTGIWLPAWILLALVLVADVRAWARMRRLAGVEWLKLARSRLFQVGLAATVLVTLLAGWTYEELPNATGWTRLAAASGVGLWCSQVFLLVLGATAVAGEATGGTMKMIVPHAYRRSDWILTKALVLLLAALLHAALVTAVAVAHAAWTDGLGDVVLHFDGSFGGPEQEVFRTADVMRGHFVDATLVGLAALGATTLMGLFLSALFDGVVPALCAAFLLFVGLEFADVLLSLPRETLLGIYAWYPGEMREVFGKLGRALSERWDDALMPAGLALSLLTGALALLLATVVFRSRDLKV